MTFIMWYFINKKMVLNAIMTESIINEKMQNSEKKLNKREAKSITPFV